MRSFIRRNVARLAAIILTGMAALADEGSPETSHGSKTNLDLTGQFVLAAARGYVDEVKRLLDGERT